MKKIILFTSIICIVVFVISCNQQQKENKESRAFPVTQVDSSKFTANMVDNKRDPSCGMPVSAGIEDTVHYKNKVLGFCSKDCKEDFLKDPEKGMTAADLKK
ncbi:MAG: YHS domain-containing protein [Ginsengibacter sp.]